ncbi:uncharacterized protein PRCAT00000056001 [Priceomyces carsonii]|uniref:uncharacterized protein n=1 Tax=Priceomyces carsonii TaxID=28549 RepID=UPI002EDA6B3F|nr:unnamed protein product [Priceomyces carsonii]
MTTGDQDNPQVLLTQLLKSEEAEYDNLIAILGFVKPSKSSRSTLAALLRGLLTKNGKLMSLLRKYTSELVGEASHVLLVFNNFIREFVDWIVSDVVILFEKYYAQLSSVEADSIESANISIFSKPILHCANYVKFIQHVVNIIRNPFIIEKLEETSEAYRRLLERYRHYIEVKKLNNISFNNVRAIGGAGCSEKSDSVSSFFNLYQIVDRSKNEQMLLLENMSSIPCELLFLSLSVDSKSAFNALAILSIPKEDHEPRSLMFPPFRINEFTVRLYNSNLVLKAIDFGAKESKFQLTLRPHDGDRCMYWFKKLSEIFPAVTNDHENESFDLKDLAMKTTMAGLGINVISPCRNNTEEDNDEFKGLNLSDSYYSLNGVKTKRLSVSGVQKSDVAPSIKSRELRPSDEDRKFSSSSGSSANSIRSQYDRSLDIINKALCSTASQTSEADSNDSQYLKIINRNVYGIEEVQEERPKSSRGEVLCVEEESEAEPKSYYLNKNDSMLQLSNDYQNRVQNKFASVPDLSETKIVNRDNLFILSNGSAINITNFGKDFNPSFNISNTRLDKTSKRKSFFSLFKKNTTKNNTQESTPKEHSNVSPTDTTFNSSCESTSVDGGENVSVESLVKEGNDIYDSAVSHLPSPFALPSSTSTYFFKPYVNGSSSSLAKCANDSEADLDNNCAHVEGLDIPQKLKDLINDDSSIDFYISPSSPKAMKISKWKQKYGKWEMITLEEKLFLKIVANYDLNKAWLILFAEEFDDDTKEEIDIPLLILDIVCSKVSVRQSSALDLQISTTNSISLQKMQIMIRCKTGDLSNAIINNINNILGVLESNSSRTGLHGSRYTSSDGTLSSSVMDNKPSKSSTLTSLLSSVGNKESSIQSPIQSHNMQKEFSLLSISSEDITNANIINNPENTRLVLLNLMPIRLQKHLEKNGSVNNPSSWKIISMYLLSIFLISDSFTGKNFYYLVLNDGEKDQDEICWLISEDDKASRIEKIGRAGLLVQVTDEDIFMIECRGKKQFKRLYDVL